jgi:hypothetical protein
MRNYSVGITRRNFLQGVSFAAANGVGAANADSADMAPPKKSKAEAAYRDTPHGNQRCEICAPFLPPDQCRTVMGPVSRHGWCVLYRGA